MAQQADIDILVRQVMNRLQTGGTGDSGIFAGMNDAVEAAFRAQKEYMKFTLADRTRIIGAIRKVIYDNAEELSRLTVEETGMGNLQDKILKNRLVADKTPGIEDLTSEAITGDSGLTLIEFSPFGVIGAITPTTNPTETLFCNSIGMLAAGNSVVFSPHPTAKNVSLKTIELINRAIIAAGAPPNLITAVQNPTLEQAGIMMAHPKINMLVATGGPGVVKAVLASGKKAIGAGAGNPPAVIDESANIEKAALDIIKGCSFDHNLPCVAEKEVLAVEKIADYLLFCMRGSGLAHFIEDAATLKRLEEQLLSKGAPAKNFIGRSAQVIAESVGLKIDAKVRVLSMELPFDHPFVQHELMMPVLPLVRVKDFDDAVRKAIEVEHGFRHTAIMHSRNVEHLSALAKAIQTTIFVKNAPSYAGIGVGGEGYTTFTIAGPTGEGLTSAKTFTRKRRCVLADSFNIK
ncbi:MAG: aldehyde dehydrogenase EutE [Spirochaetaceae bacterium]|jgi:propionaldehyde dehydrogenase|nr:aldehyde dehydrogenase EutE [Spirochaetaceae bacterium]